MTEWRDVALGDVCELKRGYDLPRSSRRAGTVPVISSSGPTGFHIEAKVRAPGVVTGRYGTLGKVFYITEDFWPLNTALYVRDFKRNNPRYVAALLQSMDLARYDGAAAVPGLNRNQLHTLPVRIPSTDTQQTIACVLSALDDLIQNNRRRIEVLEEVARATYFEWFVRFRFPGHETTEFVDSSLGPIPEGWEVVPLKDIADITMGQSPSSEYFNTHGIGVPFHQGVTDFGPLFPITQKWCSTTGRTANDGDILVSVRAPVGRINIANSELIIGRGLASLRSKDNRQALLLGHLRNAFIEEDAIGGGTIFNAIGKQELAGILTFKVPHHLAEWSDAVLDSNLAQIRVLTDANHKLVTMGELLRPKLVTGQIDVSGLDLDALVEGVVA